MQRRQNRALTIVDKTIGQSDTTNWHANVSKWRKDFESTVLDAHKVAARLGRRRAGNNRKAFRKDEKLAKAAVKADKEFLDKFEQQLRDGKYGQGAEIDKAAIDRRMFMYLDKARSTANEAFGENSPECPWTRVMLAAEHCSTCPPKAKTYPSWAALKAKGLPADGTDECLTECECIIFRESDGRAGFGSVFSGEVPSLTEDGFAPADTYIAPGKLDYLTTARDKGDKSKLMSMLGFDDSNKADIRDSILKFGSEYPLMPVPATDGLEKYISIGDFEGIEGKKARMQIAWVSDGRRGLRFNTIVVPKKSKLALYEEFLKELEAL